MCIFSKMMWPTSCSSKLIECTDIQSERCWEAVCDFVSLAHCRGLRHRRRVEICSGSCLRFIKLSSPQLSAPSGKKGNVYTAVKTAAERPTSKSDSFLQQRSKAWFVGKRDIVRLPRHITGSQQMLQSEGVGLSLQLWRKGLLCSGVTTRCWFQKQKLSVQVWI